MPLWEFFLWLGSRLLLSLQKIFLHQCSCIIRNKHYLYLSVCYLKATYLHLPSSALAKPLLYAQMLGHGVRGIFAFYEMMLKKKEGEANWLAVFNPNTFPMPPTVKSIVDTWKDDYEFCRQYLQGINPFIIKIVDDISEVPEVSLLYFLSWIVLYLYSYARPITLHKPSFLNKYR